MSCFQCRHQAARVKGALVHAAVDEEGGGAAHPARPAAVDVALHPAGERTGAELVLDPPDVEPQLAGVLDQVRDGQRPTRGVEHVVHGPEGPLRRRGFGRLGGLSDGGSKHLESRHATAEHLGSSGVPVTYLRAAAVIGSGSESFRTLYYLTKRLPVMVTPKWVNNRTQPIAIDDLIEILCQAPKAKGVRGRQIDIGGPDVTTYGGMMDAMAKAMGKRRRLKIPVPVLSPSLSSHWVGLVTPVDADVARPLVQGLSVETVVQDPSDMESLDVDFTPMDEAMELAIEEGGASLL